ncbi:DMSO/TMAO reductase YedYZ, heme-binding membrane subunit [Clostridium sp. DSM 8431]|uniref:ferric reductase-like transmembrane domain-containing protein n=1 Tax=Clostridium sp. DSM 8431 TaxID=1761781 RepID=UPI0008DF692E|nr:ferric reductase-like transmembrane domain-containing protein [Clostridium sp. DSM 8431]SFU69338.1 DMSO/TMAO reductase YedYZ, heme-binding membrane subunit [Clostridium sp. DSM 8431]
MNLILSILITAIISILFSSSIKKHKNAYYILSSLIALSTLAFEAFKISTGLKPNDNFIISLESVSAKGILSIAFFILVMYAGALNNKWTVTKKLLKVRGELAIIASILMLPHGIIYGYKFIFLTLPKFIATGNFPLLYLSVSVIGIIAFILMIPLFITSFIKVRKQMNAKSWKKLQKWAYLFYLLAYLHVFILLVNRDNINWTKLITYTLVFGIYTILRLIKAFNKKI